jgi:hypothetical protein
MSSSRLMHSPTFTNNPPTFSKNIRWKIGYIWAPYGFGQPKKFRHCVIMSQTFRNKNGYTRMKTYMVIVLEWKSQRISCEHMTIRAFFFTFWKTTNMVPITFYSSANVAIFFSSSECFG